MTQFGEAGDVITNEELALASTAYFIGNSLKALAELAWESSLREQGRRNGLRFTLQIQFGF